MFIGTRRPRAGQMPAREAHSLHILKLLLPTFGLVVAFVLVGVARAGDFSPGPVLQAVPTPTPDPLATPVMPESPTQLDIGRDAYYYNCMPCHGDKGQGLTDAWRGVWVEDHQNCWEIGCHGGHVEDAGFPIPRDVPALNGSAQALAGFRTTDDLYAYLVRTHPPQRPGALPDAEYHALAVYLFHEAGRLPVEAPIDARGLAAAGLAIGLTALGLWRARKRRRTRIG